MWNNKQAKLQKRICLKVKTMGKRREWEREKKEREVTSLMTLGFLSSHSPVYNKDFIIAHVFHFLFVFSFCIAEMNESRVGKRANKYTIY